MQLYCRYPGNIPHVPYYNPLQICSHFLRAATADTLPLSLLISKALRYLSNSKVNDVLIILLSFCPHTHTVRKCDDIPAAFTPHSFYMLRKVCLCVKNKAITWTWKKISLHLCGVISVWNGRRERWETQKQGGLRLIKDN